MSRVGALSIPLTLLMHRFLPESPKFLAISGRAEELRALLARLRPERAAYYAAATLNVSDVQRQTSDALSLLTPRYRRSTLAIWATSFLSLFCIFGLTGWIPTIMMSRGESFAASFGFGALLQVAAFIGGLLLATVTDRRKSATTGFLAAWWALGGCSILVLVFHSGHLVNMTCIACAGFMIVGAQHVLNNFTANTYDTGVRATGVGMELGVGRVGAILGPFVAGLLQSATGGPAAMFWTMGAASLLAAAIIGSLGLRSIAPADASRSVGRSHGVTAGSGRDAAA